MDHVEALFALRTRLLSTVVVTTGDIPLTAVGTGYTRNAGSFIQDGFKVGMEVQPAGFPTNPPAIIKTVAALEIKTYQAVTPAVEAPNRSLTVGIPASRSWENKSSTRTEGFWHLREEYDPGERAKPLFGSPDGRALVENYPIWYLHLEVLTNIGVSAPFLVAQVIRDRFPPNYAFEMSDGYALTVNAEPAPSFSQPMPIPEDAGKAEIVITIPLKKRSRNQV